MSKILGDNLLYRGQQPNFERDQFKTLAQMRAYNKAWLDDGHIAFCLEDKQHYAWNATANAWQLFTPSGVVKAEDTDEVVEDIEPNIVEKMRTLENDHAKFKAEVNDAMASNQQQIQGIEQNVHSAQEQMVQLSEELTALKTNVDSFHPQGMPTSGTWDEKPASDVYAIPDGYCYLLRSETSAPDNPAVITVSYKPIWYVSSMGVWYDATGSIVLNN